MPTYDWQLSRALGPARFAGVTLQNAPIASGVSIALCVKWLQETLRTGTVAATNWNTDQKVLNQPTQAAATTYSNTIGPKKFTDALPVIGPTLVTAGIEVALVGQMQDHSESKVTKAIDAFVENGRYLVVAVEKNRTNAFWYPLAISCTKKTSTVFDPYAGQFTTKKSADVAKLLHDALKNKPFATNVDAFIVLKATRTKADWIEATIVPAAAATSNAYGDLVRTEVAKPIASSYFGRDFVRYADAGRYKIVKSRKVLVDHLALQKQSKKILETLVDALGSHWPVPEDDAAYDPDENLGGTIQEAMTAHLKTTDELYKVMQLLSQTTGISYFQAWRIPMGLELNAMPKQINYLSDDFQRRGFGDRDVMWFEVDIEPQIVKVFTHIGFCDGQESPFKYKGWLHLEATVNRGTFAVTTAVPRVEFVG